ncbi:Vacuolar protein-sorting-associated protein 36 [Gamsiella multidivaricata]|nr:Vacuolar protein-sorting-associated protein 36 [Gamsiella multidivaricata]
MAPYRILYIDTKDPVRKSIGLQLRLINGIQHYGGFMSSSPKLTLDLYPRPHSSSLDPTASTSLTNGTTTLSGLDTSLSTLSLKSEPSWVCAICYHSNQGSFLKCAVCGVRKPAPSADTPIPATPVANPFQVTESYSNIITSGIGSSSPRSASQSGPMTPPIATATAMTTGGGDGEHPGIACPACTFHNDLFMIQCEICGTQLQDAQSIAFTLHRQEQHQRAIRQLPSTTDVATESARASTPTAAGVGAAGDIKSASTGGSSAGGSRFLGLYSGAGKSNVEDTNSVKLSFRAGGNSNFHTLLKAAMATRAWEAKPKPHPEPTMGLASSASQQDSTPGSSPVIKVGGISGIMRTVETNKKATDETLSQAFQDLQGLMDKAAEMVALAESISNRLAKSNTMNNEETATFKTYLLSMGIAAPVTKDTAGAVFHKELARELVEFILPIVEKEGGTMSLMDIYCVFNRARGVELISPKDLHTACQMFPDLNLPLRLRKFDSGLLVIQTMARYSDDEVSSAISKRIQELPPGAPGLSAVELASAIQISVALAQEQLLMTEARGLICRDESVEGLRFYDNLFAKWEI